MNTERIVWMKIWWETLWVIPRKVFFHLFGSLQTDDDGSLGFWEEVKRWRIAWNFRLVSHTREWAKDIKITEFQPAKCNFFYYGAFVTVSKSSVRLPPWQILRWCPEINNAIRSNKRALRFFKKHHIQENLIFFKKPRCMVIWGSFESWNFLYS